MFLYSGGLTGKFLPNRFLLTGFLTVLPDLVITDLGCYFQYRTLLVYLTYLKVYFKKKTLSVKTEAAVIVGAIFLHGFSAKCSRKKVHNFQKNERIVIYTSLPVFLLTDK